MNCFFLSNNISINFLKFLRSFYFVADSHFRIFEKKVILGSLGFTSSQHSILTFNNVRILDFLEYNGCFIKTFLVLLFFFGYSVNKRLRPTSLFSWIGWYFLVCMLIPLNWLWLGFHR